jgi:hypothetical protein
VNPHFYKPHLIFLFIYYISITKTPLLLSSIPFLSLFITDQ